VNQIPHLTPDSQKHVAKCLIDTDVDLETLSTLRDEWGGDDTLKDLGMPPLPERARESEL
jgi:hypothetical protein